MAGVMRDAQSVQFNQQQSPDVNQASVGYAAPRYGKYAGTEGRVATSSNDHPSTLSQIGAALAPALMKYTQGKIDTMQQETYMAGQAAAASGAAQDSVDTNIFTKDYATAGFADTKARMAVADAVAQTAVDIKNKYKEVSPEDFQDYLTARREKIMSMQQGMSLDARKGLMAQMMTADQQAIASHAEAYRKYAIDTQMQAINTSASVAMDALNASKGDAAAYNAATTNFVANIATNIIGNPNLDQAARSKALVQAAGLALANGHEQAYETMRNVKGPDGTTMLDHVPFDDQASLAKAYTQARKDSAGMRNGQYQANLGLFEAKLNDPLADPISYDQLQAVVDEGKQRGAISPEQETSLNKMWAESQQKKQQNVNIANSWAVGNIQGLYANNADDAKGADAFVTLSARRGVPLADTISNLAQIGLTTGSPAAFSTVGKMMRSSVNSIGANGTIDPSQLSGLNAVYSTIQQAEQKNNYGARTAFLGAFDEDSRAKIVSYWEGLKAGKDSSVAAQDAADQQQATAALTAPQKAALAASHAKENQDLVNALQPKGLWSQIWAKAVPDAFRSKNNVNADKISANNSQGIFSWKDDPNSVEAANAAGKTAVLQELSTISQRYPYMSKDGREQMALSNVAGRTIDTLGGPVIMPQGQNIQSFFGVPPSVSPGIVSSALNSMHQPGKDQRVVYKVAASGQMQWQVYGKDGTLVNPGGTFDPKDVAAAAQAEQDRLSARAMETDGSGVMQTSKDGGRINYNGNNTVGLGTASALQVRNDLFKYEGFTATPYDDASGKVVNGKRVQTVGVGVSSTNDFYPKVQADGKVSDADLRDSFMRASNQAMNTANTAQGKLPARMQQNSSTLRLFSQLAYQGGSVPNDLVKAMQAGDREGAMNALTSSPQYKLAHAQRRVFYTDLMRGIMPVTY